MPSLPGRNAGGVTWACLGSCGCGASDTHHRAAKGSHASISRAVACTPHPPFPCPHPVIPAAGDTHRALLRHLRDPRAHGPHLRPPHPRPARRRRPARPGGQRRPRLRRSPAAAARISGRWPAGGGLPPPARPGASGAGHRDRGRRQRRTARCGGRALRGPGGPRGGGVWAVLSRQGPGPAGIA